MPPGLDRVKITIRKGWPERKADVQSELKVYFDIRDELVIDEELVFKVLRCLVPAAARQETLERIHPGHIGQEGCVRRARKHVHWPGMTSEIKDCQLMRDVSKVHSSTAERNISPGRPTKEAVARSWGGSMHHSITPVPRNGRLLQ